MPNAQPIPSRVGKKLDFAASPSELPAPSRVSKMLTFVGAPEEQPTPESDHRCAVCGARTRRGMACIRKPLANGRCPNHGGLSTGPKSEAGRQRIAEAQRRRWAKSENRAPA